MAQKPTEKLKEKLALSVLKHPWKWGLGAGALGIGKFAAAGWAIGKMRGSKNPKKTSSGTKHKTTHLSPGGKYDYKITSYKKQPKKYMAG